MQQAIEAVLPQEIPLDKVTAEEVFAATEAMNNKPRKCLEYKTPWEAFYEMTGINTKLVSSGALSWLNPRIGGGANYRHRVKPNTTKQQKVVWKKLAWSCSYKHNYGVICYLGCFFRPRQTDKSPSYQNNKSRSSINAR